MIDLKPFQQEAADQLASRVTEYINDPVFRGRGKNQRHVPFVQFLHSITASGKTVVLADAVSQICALAPISPVILWISRLTVVVEQTFTNLEPGGAYNHLISSVEVRALGKLSEDKLRNSDSPFLYFATVGTFNISAKEGRKVFETQWDSADQSIWDSLLTRRDPEGLRRPLIVVYDEAHNLSDQQTHLLLGLEPDAFLLSTATAKMPNEFQEEVVRPLKSVGEFSDEDLNTVVPASEVAKSGLVKQRIDLIGRQGSMEDVVGEMIDEMQLTQKDAVSAGLRSPVKAVYICRTNIREGDDGRRDDPEIAFVQRQAPPILIWRHLVENLGVDPSTIAVYCDLKMNAAYPAPNGFNLLRGGEKSYADFIAGEYTHIIFNQSLQEGWDDPLVYFAYIDKTLSSTIAAEQIVGRLLRQPEQNHFPQDRLNAAQLFIRVESNKVFDEVVLKIQDKLDGDGAEVTLTRTDPTGQNRTSLTPRASRFVPAIATHTEDAVEEMELIAGQVPNFKDNTQDTNGVGRRTRVQRILGDSTATTFEWEEIGSSSKVSARWLFDRSLRKYHRDAAASVLLRDPKWNALIGVGSPAALILEKYAEEMGTSFIQNSYVEIADDDDDDFEVGEALVRRDKLVSFDNSLHEGYSDLNPSLELPFAKALDTAGFPWARNPSRSGFGVPLIRQGGNDTFYPDFLVWAHEDVYAIDTKGSHLKADAVFKLVRIKQSAGRPRVHIRFVIEGHWDAQGTMRDKNGFTVLGFKPDGDVSYTPVADIKQGAAVAVKRQA